MNKFWRDLIRRVFIIFCLIAIPIIGYEIIRSPFRRGHWVSIVKLQKDAPAGTEIENVDALPEINFTELKNYRFYKGQGVPPQRLKDLEGQVVQLKGYVMQPLRGDMVKDFSLVGDLLTCCFGGKPLINAVVVCDLEEGKYFPYRIAAHRIIGRFYMKPERNDKGEVVKLYRMRVYDVQRLKR